MQRKHTFPFEKRFYTLKKTFDNKAILDILLYNVKNENPRLDTIWHAIVRTGRIKDLTHLFEQLYPNEFENELCENLLTKNIQGKTPLQLASKLMFNRKVFSELEFKFKIIKHKRDFIDKACMKENLLRNKNNYFDKLEIKLNTKLSGMVIKDIHNDYLSIYVETNGIFKTLQTLQLKYSSNWPNNFSITNFNLPLPRNIFVSFFLKIFSSKEEFSNSHLESSISLFINLPYYETIKQLLTRLVILHNEYVAIKKSISKFPPSLCIFESLQTRNFLQKQYSALGEVNYQNNFGQYGSSIVIPINDLHFKRYPKFPGIDYAVGKLASLISCKGTIPTSLVRVISPNNFSIPYQVSLTIEGINLVSLLLHFPTYLEKLSGYSFSSCIILGLLSNLMDAKPDNFILQVISDKNNEIQSLDIVSVDNEMAFSEYTLNTNNDGRMKVFPIVKNVLYFLPQMKEKISDNYKKDFLQSSPELIIIEWLYSLWKRNNYYNELLEKCVFTIKDFEGGSKIRGMKLPVESISSNYFILIYQKLLKIQNILKMNADITHEQLFETIQPSLSFIYNYISQKNNGDILKSLTFLYEKVIKNNDIVNEVLQHELNDDNFILKETFVEKGIPLHSEVEKFDVIQIFIKLLKRFNYLPSFEYTALQSQKTLIIFEKFCTEICDCTFIEFICKNKLLSTLAWILDSKFLLVDSNIQSGNTLLHYCCKFNFEDGIKLLLTHNANIEIKNDDDRKAIEYGNHSQLIRTHLNEINKKTNELQLNFDYNESFGTSRNSEQLLVIARQIHLLDISSYEVIDKIGGGCNGCIFLCRVHLGGSNSLLVALKMILNFYGSSIANSYQNEYTIIHNLPKVHANIIQLFHYFTATPTSKMLSFIDPEVKEFLIEKSVHKLGNYQKNAIFCF